MPRTRSRGTADMDAEEVTHDEGYAMLDRAARECLNVSGEEFLIKWDAGEYEDMDDPLITRVAMLIPFAR